MIFNDLSVGVEKGTIVDTFILWPGVTVMMRVEV